MCAKKVSDHIFEGKIREFEKLLIEFFIEIGENKRQSKPISIISGYLMIHGELTQNQLKELTGFSLATISINLNALTSYGLVERKLIKGSHQFAYSFTDNYPQIIEQTSVLTLDIVRNITKIIKNKEKELQNHRTKEGYNHLSERIRGILNFLRLFENLTLTIKDLRMINQ